MDQETENKKTKLCKECKVEKNINEFHKQKGGKDGLRAECKECKNKKYKERCEKIISGEKEKVVKNKKICCRCKIEKDVDEFCKDKSRIDGRVSACNDCRKKWKKEYLSKEENTLREKNRNKAYKQLHKSHRSELIRNRRKNDPIFRIRSNISTSILRALKSRRSSKKGNSCFKFLSYTVEQLKEHLESQFEYWMCWENHGVYNPSVKTWQIDHIIPHSSFHYETMDCEEFRKCWALENLRPLETIENIKKGNRG